MGSDIFHLLDKYMGRTRIMVCIVSNRPNLLDRNLMKQAEEIDENTLMCIMTDANCVKGNEPFVSKVSGLNKNVIQIDFDSILLELKKNRSDIPWDNIVSSRLSGKKNLALAIAHKMGADIIFLEDDVTPMKGWFHRYKSLFDEGYDLITGVFLGQNASYLDLFSKICDTVSSAHSMGEIEEKISSLLKRRPKSLMSIESAILLTGGNMGISKDLCEKLCFPPTDYRNDDINYWIAATRLEIRCPYNEMLKNPDRYDEIIKKLPFVIHENEPIQKNQFINGFIRDIKTQITGKAVAEYILGGSRLDWGSILKSAYTMGKRNEERIQEKIEKLKIDFRRMKENKDRNETKESLENLNELERICAISPGDYYVTEKEIKFEVERYHTAREYWGALIRAVKEL
jgi:hypothetical protein